MQVGPLHNNHHTQRRQTPGFWGGEGLGLVLFSQERKIYYIHQPQYSADRLWAAWPKFLQFRVGAPAAIVLFVNPASPLAYDAVPSLPPPLPPPDLPSAYLSRAPWCLPEPSASRQVEQVTGAVGFWLCFPVFWHQPHSCVCSVLVIVSSLRNDNLFGLWPVCTGLWCRRFRLV